MLNLRQEPTSKSIGGISDLVVWAPIREGFIHAFENITYETRLRLTADALYKVRVSAREHETIAPFPDTAERILSLLNFRIGIVDDQLFRLAKAQVGGKPGLDLTPRRYMYLVATFDGPWEPYMRLIWNPLGPFLDLLLCNCVPYGDPGQNPGEDVSLDGYKLAQDSSFSDYAAWVRAHQLDPAIFYSTTGLTVRDQIYLAKLERLQRTSVPPMLEADLAKITHDFPEALAADVRLKHVADTARLGLEALTVLYRLADYYPPYLPNAATLPGDGRLLLHAASDLLIGLDQTLGIIQHVAPDNYKLLSAAYAEPLAWFRRWPPPVPTPGPAIATTRTLDRREVQKGILTPYDAPAARVTHAALLFMQVSDAAKARRFLKTISVDWEDAPPPPAGHVFHNVAFTFEGLRRLELADDVLLSMPKEFREGSAERAPTLGDIGPNHPREWSLPPRNWPEWPTPNVPRNPPVDLSEIDFVLQLRISRPPDLFGDVDYVDFWADARATYDAVLVSKAKPDAFLRSTEASVELLPPVENPLARRIGILAAHAKRHGVSLLALESAVRLDDPANPSPGPTGVDETIVDHFGFRDGISQPAVDETIASSHGDAIPPGDLVVGFRNSLHDDDLPPAGAGAGWLCDSGSFMVLRKMEQDRAALDRFTMRSQAENPDMTQDEIAAALVGRSRDGKPLIDPNQVNGFDYAGDPTGELCPFSAHIRRANPRNEFQKRSAPRMLRRGLTFGHRYDPSKPDKPRGSLFIAYVASIAEQYEVVQRWLNGGNPTGVNAAQDDPLTSRSAGDVPRTFRFFAKGKLRHLTMPDPFVTLDYMLYLFVPSATALRMIIDPRSLQIKPAGDVATGDDILARLNKLPDKVKGLEWKRLTEDFDSKDPSQRSEGPDIWAAIRTAGGVAVIKEGIPNLTANLATAGLAARAHGPRVVLVGDDGLIKDVLKDSKRFSSAVQGYRTTNSFGAIFVAMDPGATYDLESRATNEIVWEYSRDHQDDVFDLAYSLTEARLAAMMQLAEKLTGKKDFKLELRRELFMPVLAELCRAWFDIPDAAVDALPQYIEAGAWGWDAVTRPSPGGGTIAGRAPRCPADFMAPSRYCFYPNPTPTITAFGEEHGQALRAASLKIVAKYKSGGIAPKGAISRRMYQQIADPDLLARNLIGLMEGMLPPTDGILRGIVYEWLDQNSLWRNQGALHRKTLGAKPTLAQASDALGPSVAEAMCKRPAPDLIYRIATAKADGTYLGRKKIREGDCIVLGLISAMQASLPTNPDIWPVFGGQRVSAHQPANAPAHACPAQKMVMASVYGILSALLDSGRIIAQPASLIIEIRDFP